MLIFSLLTLNCKRTDVTAVLACAWCAQLGFTFGLLVRTASVVGGLFAVFQFLFTLASPCAFAREMATLGLSVTSTVSNRENSSSSTWIPEPVLATASNAALTKF